LTPVCGRVITVENLITGSLAYDDVAMGGYHIRIHRPSGSGGAGIAAARPLEEGCMAVSTRGFGGRRRDDTDLKPGQYRTTTSAVSSRETAPTRPVAFGAAASSFEPDVRTRSADGDRLDRLCC
jgi:hypothetical protein